MCDKSHFGKPVGRFDKDLVETYRGANVEAAHATRETTGAAKTIDGSRQVKGFCPQPDRT